MFCSNSKVKKTKIILFGAIAAVVLIFIIFICISLFGGGYKKTINDLVDYYNNRSTSTEFFNLTTWGKAGGEYGIVSSEISMRSLGDDYDEDDLYDDWKERIAKRMESTYDRYDDAYGSNWKISYEIKSVSKIRDHKMEELQEEWDSFVEYGEEGLEQFEEKDNISEKALQKLEKIVEKMKKKKITTGYKIKINLIIEGDEDDKKISTTLYVVKIGGDWVLHDGLYILPYY